MKKLIILSFVCLSGFFQYCSSTKKTASVKPALDNLTYISNIQPTIQAKCSPCHIPPKGTKKSLDTYDAVKANIDDITRRINLNTGDRDFMPYKHSKLSDSVINIFAKWNADGMKEK